jgi:hypothetical protein
MVLRRALAADLLEGPRKPSASRLLVFTQADDAIPLPFFIVLVFWLVAIFASFSLFAEPGPDRRRVNACFRALGIERAVFDRRSKPPLPGPDSDLEPSPALVLPKIE